MHKLITFTKYCDMVKLAENVIENAEYLEDFLDSIDDAMLETVVVGDMAQVTAPLISKLKSRKMYERTPPGLEHDAVAMKPAFKKQYGDDYKQIMYATLWKRYNSKHHQ